jgi:hypothetical protein
LKISGTYWEPIQREIRDGPKSDTDVAVDILRTLWRRED